MSTGGSVSWQEASATAGHLMELLRPACLRIEVAGSIRRGRPEVHDIELVAVPRTRLELQQTGLWAPEEVLVNDLQLAIDRAIANGVLEVHPTDPKRGQRYAKLMTSTEDGTPVQLDLFMPASLEVFGLLLLIRTGPAAFSQRVVTDARRSGYHVADGELHTGAMSCIGASTRHCSRVPTPEERDVFDRLGMRWIAPRDRA